MSLDSHGALELLLALAPIPALGSQRPRCLGEHDMYDRADKDPAAREQCLQLCAACPCKAQCAEWLAGLPDKQRPDGTVVAGEYFFTPDQPRAAQATSIARPQVPRVAVQIAPQRTNSRRVDKEHQARDRARQTARVERVQRSTSTASTVPRKAVTRRAS